MVPTDYKNNGLFHLYSHYFNDSVQDLEDINEELAYGKITADD